MVTSKIALSPLHDAPADQSIRVVLAGDQAFQDRVTQVLDCPDVAFIESVRTSGALVDKLNQAGFDCVVIDRTLGRQSSLAVYEVVIAKCSRPPPVIMLTAEMDAKAAVDGFRAGFADYVARDHEYATELIHSIRRAVRRARKSQAAQDELDYLSKIAKYDRLTGLPSRKYLEDRITSLIASGERHGNEFALFLIDINNFRQINDIYGHAVGDQALKAFARKLMLTARSSDALGRFGGDEFLYLIDRDVSYETVERACNRLASSLTFAVELDAVGFSLSASIGAAIFPADGTTADELLTAADHAMFAAKAAGAGYCLVRAIEETGSELAEAATPAVAGKGNARRPTNGQAAAPVPTGDQAAAAAPGATLGHRNENRRSERRNRVFKRGRIIFGDGFSTIDCMIRDLSRHGARISVEDQLVVPQKFSFAVLDNGTVYLAARRWQQGRSIGVEFVIDDAPDHAANGANGNAGDAP
jgi:diguanylate cyclase (GGDEF)-like protein